MEKITTVCEENFRCRTINKNGEPIATDAGVDHGGKGEAYSPVDMVVVSLCSCVLTVMSMVAKQHSVELKGAQLEAHYDMADKPARRIGKIWLHLILPKGIPEAKRPILERTIKMCPVHNSLHPDIQHDLKVDYTA